MKYKEARDLFRNDRNSFGQTRAPMTKLKQIYESINSQVCGNCKFYNEWGICDNNNSAVFEKETWDNYGCNVFERKENE